MTAAAWRPLVAITLVALALRVINLSGRTTEYDEIVSVWFAAADFARMVRGTAADTMPPLYYALLHLWAPEVAPLWWERLPSVACSAATVPVVYVLGRLTTGAVPARLAALLAAVSPFFVFYGQFARMYALLALLVLMAAVCLLLAARGRLAAWAGYTGAAVAALYTHNLAVLNLAALHVAALTLLPALKGWRGYLVRLAAADAVAVLCYLPWLTYLPEQLAKVNRAFWITQPGAAELVRTPIMFLFNLPAPSWALPVLLFWTVLLLAASGVAVRRTGGVRSMLAEPGLAFLLALAVAPVALMFLVSQVRPVYVERGVMASAAAWYVLLGWGYVRLRRWERRLLAGGALVLIAASLLYYYSYAEFPRARYQEAAAWLGQELRPGDAVLHETKLSYFPMRYFRPDLPQHFVADPPGSPNDTLAPATMATFGIAPTRPEDLAQAEGRVWVVLYQRSFAEAARAGGEPPVLSVLASGRARGPAVMIGDLVLVPLLRGGP